MHFTEDQIKTLSPDDASFKAGLGLASMSKWVSFAKSTRALWGECQGSGKLPYQTQVDIQNLAFKCTCPSRKFPCKHGIGLLLLNSRQAGNFKESEEPSWVADWLSKRSEKSEKKQETVDKLVDEAAQAKRLDARMKKVGQGLDDLQTWLEDLVKEGLLTLPSKTFEFWNTPIKRLVDAQAPGVANLLTEVSNINYFSDEWQEKAIYQLSKLNLICESFKNITQLKATYQEELKTLIGFNQSKETLLSQNGISDEWMLVAKYTEALDKLQIEKNWFWGKNSKKFGLLLQFIAPGQLPEHKLAMGMAIKAEFVFYRGLYNQRVLIKGDYSQGNMHSLEYVNSFQEAMDHHADFFEQNPFIQEVPALIDGIQFAIIGKRFVAVDQQQLVLNVKASQESFLYLLAQTGGKPTKVFALISESEIVPISLLS